MEIFTCISVRFLQFVFYIFRKQQGSAPYVVEVGGSSYVGMFGYLAAFQEMMNQVLEAFIKVIIINYYSQNFETQRL